MSESRHIHTNPNSSDGSRKIRRAQSTSSGSHSAYAGSERSGRSGYANEGYSRQPVRRPAGQSVGTNGSRSGNGRRRRKKTPVWVPLVVVLCVIGMGVGVVLGYVNHIMSAVHDDNAAQIADEVKTAEEYKGDVLGVLICGIDYEEGRTYGASNDGQTNDGMTDMIMYFQFDVKNHKINMLQIPRNTLVGKSVTCSDTTGKTYKASNGQINSIMKSNDDGMAALADVVANNYKLPVDHYATVDMDALKELVNRFGGVEVYIPQDIKSDGSFLPQGYHNLDGNQVEFFVRNRHSYADQDISRMNMQRYFYAGLFKRIRSANVAEIINLTPVITYFVKTDMDAATCISLGVSFLKVDSADILVAQTPVYTATEKYETNSVLVPDRTDIADLLNQYYRDYTGPIDASQLNLADNLVGNTGVATSANVQRMGQLDQEANTAIENGDTDVEGAYTTDAAPDPNSAAS
ncbi:MAG: LCP family protein [Faecalibacterium sp.]|jgi:LCP family protein required for cell wall assembly|nr:LCP family protein [Faecalibacterium sp.]